MLEQSILYSQAAHRLLVACHQIRDYALNHDLSHPIDADDRFKPIDFWIDEFSPLFSTPAGRRPSHLAYFRSLGEELTKYSLDSNAEPPHTGLRPEVRRQLVESVQVALKTLAMQTSIESAIQARVESAMYDFAYGLTHEINNPLGNIAARAQQLLKGAQDDRERKSLATIYDQSMRAHEMLAEMMRVVKPIQRSLQPISLQELLRSVVEIAIDRYAASQVSFEFLPDHDPSPQNAAIVDGNFEALQHVLLSLLQNSVEACSPSDQISIQLIAVPGPCASENPAGGTLPVCDPRAPGVTHRRSSAKVSKLIAQNQDRFFESAVEPGESGSSMRGNAGANHEFVGFSEKSMEGTLPDSQGSWWVIVLRDTGAGMSPEACKRASHLYFSGREQGRGLGIGLSFAKREITALGGRLEIESHPGVGTTVTVWLRPSRP